MATLTLSKLTPPPLRAERLVRERLLALADDRPPRRITLIAAPAGFGKTTLARELAARSQRPFLWLSLTASDSEPQRLASYLVHGLTQLADPPAHRLQPLLQLSPFPAELFWQGLSNALTAAQRPLHLILDDYHLIDNPAIHAHMANFVETLPAGVQLLLTSRTSPPLPLARWRGKGWLNEIGQQALRFRLPEAQDFFADCMEMALPQEIVAELEARTEGWVTGLQLAALSLQQRSDQTAFMAEFSGSHRFVLDYLLDEVVAHQPPEVEAFLLATAVLERFCAPLAAALLGPASSEASTWEEVIAYLEQHNLFVIPLDDERRWYRYHHLFADMLRARLVKQQGEEGLVDLRLRAARWCITHGLTEEGIEYGLAAGAYAEAADWICAVADSLWTQGETGTFQRWLSQLPNPLLAGHPQAAIYLAWGHFFHGQMMGEAEFHWGRAESLLQQAEGVLRQPENRDVRELGRLAAAQTALASVRQDVARTIEHGELARRLLANESSLWHSVALISLGFVYRMSGKRAEGLELLAAGSRMAEACGNFSGAMFARDQWGSMLLEEGELAAAEQVYEAGLAHATRLGAETLPIVGQLYAGLGRLARANGRWEAAHRWLTQAIELLEQGGFDSQAARRWLADIEPVGRQPQVGLVEPLSQRELQILDGLAQGLSNREIGERLFIATGTVKTHTSNIYGKLGVRDRTQAVLKAQELGLI